METVGLWSQTAWWVELLFNVLLFVLPALAAVAITTAGGATMIATIRTAWKTIRPALDEPSDVAIRYLALKTKRTPEEVSAWLITNGDGVVALLAPATMPDGARVETAVSGGAVK